MSLTHITQNIWMYPFRTGPNVVQGTVGVIVGRWETVLVDAGNSPELARLIQKELRKINAPPVSHIVYTHHHWDHVFGAYVFNGITAVAHQLCHAFLTELQQKHIDAEYIRLKIERNPNLELGFIGDDWTHFHFVLPHITFQDTYQLELEGIKLELVHVGGKHAADSIAVKAIEAGVMFLGDCYYPPPAYEDNPDDSLSIDMLASLVNEAYHTYIDAHKPPYTKRELDRIVRSHKRIRITRMNE